MHMIKVIYLTSAWKIEYLQKQTYWSPTKRPSRTQREWLRLRRLPVKESNEKLDSVIHFKYVVERVFTVVHQMCLHFLLISFNKTEICPKHKEALLSSW